MKYAGALVLLAATGLHAQDVRISDFRIPESRATRLIGNLQANGYRTARDYQQASFASGMTLWRDDLAMEGFAGGQVFYSLLRMNEEYTNDLSAAFNAGWDYRYSEEESRYSFKQPRKDRTWRDNGNIGSSIIWTGRYYGSSDGWFVFGSGRLDGSYFLSERLTKIADSSLTLKQSDLSRTYGYIASFSGGIGFGKVRDGTNVFVVLRILENLKADGLLSRDLSRHEILGLVSLYSKMNEYQMTQERFLKFYLGNLLRMLEEAGALTKMNVDTYSTLRTLEVLSERIQPRLFGWRVQGGIEHHSSQYRRTFPGITTFEKSALDFVVAEAEYGIDLSLWSHARAALVTRIPLVPRRDRLINMEGIASFSHEMSERIEFVASHRSTVVSNGLFSIYEPGAFRKEIVHTVSSALYFFVENNVNFMISVGYTHRTNHFSSPNYAGRDATASFAANVGITYRFF